MYCLVVRVNVFKLQVKLKIINSIIFLIKTLYSNTTYSLYKIITEIIAIRKGISMGPEKILREVRTHLKAVINRKSPVGESLWNEFVNLHPVDIAQFLSELDPEQFKELFLVLPQELVCEVFSELTQSYQVLALSSLTNANRVDVLSCLTADEMTDIFENLSDNDLKKYLNLLHKRDRDKVLSLLKFDPQSAGGIMDTEVLALQDDYTVKKSIELIQRLEVRKELHRQIYVINSSKELVGHILLEDLVLQRPEALIRSFMRKNELVAQAHEDQETIVQKMVHYNLLTVPVVGKDNFFLGVIPSSTLIDVLEEEASEDVYRMSGMQPIKGTYFTTSFGKLVHQRVYILIALLLAQSLSSIIIKQHETLLSGFLIMFLTMLTSAGGNASSQTSAIIIQGMATGEIGKNNIKKFLKREMMLALAMALILGATAFVRVYFTSHNFLGSIAVSTSLMAIVTIAIAIGGSIPVVLQRLNIDPAHSAGPVLATLIDILGVIIYCKVSKIFM